MSEMIERAQRAALPARTALPEEPTRQRLARTCRPVRSLREGSC